MGAGAEAAIVRLLGKFASPAGRGGRLSILIYHRVLAGPDPLLGNEPDAESFAAQMAYVASRFTVLPLGEAINRLYRDALPARALSVTFDDGYADNYSIAFPILRELSIPAAFFVTTGYLDGGRMWNDTVIESVRRASGPWLDLSNLALGTYDLESLGDRRRAIDRLLKAVKYQPKAQRDDTVAAIAELVGAQLPNDLMMSRKQVQELRSATMEIGAHTVSHPILARIGSADAEREIVDSKSELEAIIGEKVQYFAYPNGKPIEDYAAEHVALARRIGFRAAVTTSWGSSCRHSDPFQLPRFTPWDRANSKFALRLLLNTRRSGVELR